MKQELSAVNTAVSAELKGDIDSAIAYTRFMEMWVYSLRFAQFAMYGHVIGGLSTALEKEFYNPLKNNGVKFNMDRGFPRIMDPAEDWDGNLSTLGGANQDRPRIRVLETKGGYIYTVPFEQESDRLFNLSAMGAWFNTYSGDIAKFGMLQNASRKLIDHILTFLGDEFFNIEEAYSHRFFMTDAECKKAFGLMSVSPEDIEELHKEELYGFHFADVEEEDMIANYPKWFYDNFEGFELLSPPLTRSNGAFTVNIIRGVDDKGAPRSDSITVTSLRQFSGMGLPEPEREIKEREYIQYVMTRRQLFSQAMFSMDKLTANYATQNTSGARTQLSMIGRYIISRYTNEVLNNNYVDTYYHRQVSEVRDLNRTVPLAAGTAKPGVDTKTGLGLTPAGYPIYLPRDLDTIDDYEARLRKIAEQDPDGAFYLWDVLDIPKNYALMTKPVTERPRPALDLPANQIVYVDWRNRVVATTDGNANLSVEDVSTYRPLNMRSLKIFLDYKITTYGASATNRQQYVADIVTRILTTRAPGDKLPGDYLEIADFEQMFTDSPNPPNAQRLEALKNDVSVAMNRGMLGGSMGAIGICLSAMQMYYEALGRAIPGFPNDESAEKFDWLLDMKDRTRFYKTDSFTLADIRADSRVPVLRAMSRLFKEMYKHWKSRFEQFTATRAVLNAIEEFAFLKIMAVYPEKYDELNQRVLSSSPKQADKQAPKKYVPKPMQGLREGYTMLPHQARADYFLHDAPDSGLADFTIMNVQAGGGKTHMVLTDIARRIESGDVKKPLVMCPSYLMKNYIEDGHYMFEGRYNIVPINLADVRDYDTGSGKLGLDGIRQMINSCPPNTVFVTNYNFINPKSSSRDDYVYGTVIMSHNPTLDVLLEGNFDYLACDESHELRNVTSGHHQAAKVLFANIGRGILATGTFVNTRLEDSANQFNMVNPAVFGDATAFTEEFGEKVSGGKIIIPKDDAMIRLDRMLSDNCRYVQIKRREWAALLPTRKDQYHVINLDPEDLLRQLYDGVLHKVLEQIEKALKENKKLAKAAEDGALDDEENAGALSSLMDPYLQRLEKLLLNPEADEDFETILGNAKLPPTKKVLRAIHICRKHLNGMNPGQIQAFNEDPENIGFEEQVDDTIMEKGIPPTQGKIIILCAYHSSTKAIYEAMDPELQSLTIQYTAGDKDRAVLEFQTNPNKKILLGVGTSLSTGWNLQVATRIIRMEAVWSPGELEQSESRINRPDPKGIAAGRDAIYYDWIVVNGTIDISKMSRLVSRILMTTMFEEVDNPEYDSIKPLPPIPMNLDTIKMMQWLAVPQDAQLYQALGERNLFNYLVELRKVRRIQEKEYAEFKTTYKGDVTPVPVASAAVPKTYKAVIDIPFIEGQSVPGLGKLGIVRYSQYVNDMSGGDLNALVNYDATGVRVYTSEGDGIIIGHTKGKVTVRIGKESRSFDKLKVFVYTDPQLNRGGLLKFVGLPPVTREGKDATAIIQMTSPAKKAKGLEEPKPKPKTQTPETPIKVVKTRSPVPETQTPEEDTQVEVWASIINGALALTIDYEDDDVQSNTDFFKGLGFQITPRAYYAEVKNRKQYTALLDLMEAKFDVPSRQMNILREYEELFNEGRTKLLNAVEAYQAEIVDFYRVKHRVKEEGTIVPYVLVEEGRLYVMLDADKQPSSRKASRLKVPGVTWDVQERFLNMLFTKKADAAAVIKEIQGQFTISNIDDLRSSFKELKIVRK